jgi:hypothetical protein
MAKAIGRPGRGTNPVTWSLATSTMSARYEEPEYSTPATAVVASALMPTGIGGPVGLIARFWMSACGTAPPQLIAARERVATVALSVPKPVT